MMGQEHKLTSDTNIAEAQAFLSSQGYISIWTKATWGDGGGAAGGTFVAAVPELGLRSIKVKGHAQWSPRMTSGIVTILAWATLES